jgi:glycerol-3-phosphate O-acyltransferase/dihydroxyacetone phosphate acyltransferase
MRENPEVQSIIEEVTDYRMQLKILNIRDSQVKDMKINIFHLFWNFMVSFVRCVFSLVFALPGILMLIPLALFVSYFAEKERRKALASSDVKVKGVDVMASFKVAATLVLYPF